MDERLVLYCDGFSRAEEGINIPVSENPIAAVGFITSYADQTYCRVDCENLDDQGRCKLNDRKCPLWFFASFRALEGLVELRAKEESIVAVASKQLPSVVNVL